MQPTKLKYFLTYNNIRTEIVFSPSGWDTETIVGYKRDQTYFGVLRSMGLPLKFVLDGATILRQALYQSGIGAEVRIEVEELNSNTWQFENIFTGDIDFSKFKDMGDFFEVPLMESGFSADLKAFEAITYEYPLAGSDIVNVILPGVGFTETSTGIFLNSGSNDTDDYIPGSNKSSAEVPSGFITTQSVSKSDNYPDFTTSGSWFMTANRAVDITIAGTVSCISIVNNGSFRIVDNQNTILLNVPMPFVNGDQNIPSTAFNVTFQTIPGRRYFFFLTTASRSQIFISDGEYAISFTTTSDPSNCKGIKGFDLYKRIMKRISNGTPVASSLLTGYWKNLVFTSGDGIRGISTAAIKISFKDFFTSIQGIDDAGLGIENGIARLENKNYFARNIQSVNVGHVKNFSLAPATQYIFNSIKIGYDDGNTNALDGKQEYNSGQVWELPITRIQAQVNWMSIARADQFGIEQTRLDYLQAPTTDTSNDNAVFMLDCEQNMDGINYQPILGNSYTLVQGLTSPLTAYNLNLSPKRNLLRHSGYLRSILNSLDGRFINFGSGTKNTSLLTIKNGSRVMESQNIPVSTLDGKYFLPYIATITTDLPINTMNLIDNMPFGYVAFSWQNVQLKGFIMETSVDVSQNTERQYVLLLTTDNNLINLV